MINTGRGGRNFFRLNALYRVFKDIKLIPSMMKDYLSGEYRKVPYWTMGAALIAVLYVLSPLDAIPDYILGLGQIDDALVVWLCLLIMEKDLNAYKQWKSNRSS